MDISQTRHNERQAPARAPETLPGNEILEKQITDLRTALIARDVIGQAKGVIRILFQCDEDAAFAGLVQLSQDSHCRVAQLAPMILDMVSNGQALAQVTMSSLKRGVETHQRSQV